MRTKGREGREEDGKVVCCMTSRSTCKTLRAITPTYTAGLVMGERYWRSLARSTHCSPTVPPARLMLDGQ